MDPVTARCVVLARHFTHQRIMHHLLCMNMYQASIKTLTGSRRTPGAQ